MDPHRIVTIALIALMIVALVFHFRGRGRTVSPDGRSKRLGAWGILGLVSCALLLLWIALLTFVGR